MINLTPCSFVDVFQDFVAPQKAISSRFGMHMKFFLLLLTLISKPRVLGFLKMNLTKISIFYDLYISVYSSWILLLSSSSKVSGATVAVASPLQIIHFTKALLLNSKKEISSLEDQNFILITELLLLC